MEESNSYESLPESLKLIFSKHETVIVENQEDLENIGENLPLHVKLVCLYLGKEEVFLVENAKKFVRKVGAHPCLDEFFIHALVRIQNNDREEFFREGLDVITVLIKKLIDKNLLSVCAFVSALAIPRLGANSKVTLLKMDILRRMKDFVYD